MERADVVVVGAGAMGSATARALGERGVDTVLLEQFTVGHGRGSSHGATRIFRFAYQDSDYVRMAMRAERAWRDLEDASGETLLVRTGGVDAGPGAQACADAMAACDAEHEWLSRATASAAYPHIDFAGYDRVLRHPAAGVCLAAGAVAAQVRLARMAGVSVREETPVSSVEPGPDGVRVRTPEGEIEARCAVVTPGPWAGRLLGEMLGAPRAFVATWQTTSYYRPADGSAPPELPTFIEWTGPAVAWYAVPAVGDAPGVKLGDHDVGPTVDPDDGPFALDEPRVRETSEYVRRRFPGLDPEPVLAEVCHYTMTPDEDFVLDRVGPVVIGAGFSGHGFKFTPLVGEILADLAMGRTPDAPMARFAANRPALLG
jgi:sarcosine oxidase